MPEAAHIKACKKVIMDIEGKTYFPAALPVYEDVLAEIIADQTVAGLNEDAAKKVATISERLSEVL